MHWAEPVKEVIGAALTERRIATKCLWGGSGSEPVTLFLTAEQMDDRGRQISCLVRWVWSSRLWLIEKGNCNSMMKSRKPKSDTAASLSANKQFVSSLPPMKAEARSTHYSVDNITAFQWSADDRWKNRLRLPSSIISTVQTRHGHGRSTSNGSLHEQVLCGG